MLRRPVILAVLLALALVAAVAVYSIQSTIRGVPDAYAKWDAGEILVDHLRHHDDRWPSGWDDLRPSYDRLAAAGRLRGGLRFDQIRSRLRIDWDPDLRAAADGTRPFRAVEAVSGGALTWAGTDPNEVVAAYLRRPRTRPTTRESAP